MCSRGVPQTYNRCTDTRMRHGYTHLHALELTRHIRASLICTTYIHECEYSLRACTTGSCSVRTSVRMHLYTHGPRKHPYTYSTQGRMWPYTYAPRRTTTYTRQRVCTFYETQMYMHVYARALAPYPQLSRAYDRYKLARTYSYTHAPWVVMCPYTHVPRITTTYTFQRVCAFHASQVYSHVYARALAPYPHMSRTHKRYKLVRTTPTRTHHG